MKLVVLGLDGLDPDLVERWSMHWFKLRAWGRHFVGFLKTLYTPIVWGCFLTGMNVEELGYNIEYIHRERERMRFGWLYPLYRLRTMITKKPLGIRRLLTRLGLIKSRVFYTPSMPEDLRSRTFLEELKSMGYAVAAIEVPGYNEWKNERYRSLISELVEQRAPLSERMALVDEALRDSIERFEACLGEVERGCDLAMVYSPLPDLAFHVVPSPGIKELVWLRRIHYELYRAAAPLIELARSRGYAVLIVSDHGFDLKRYYHSDYGFWSLSVDPPPWWCIQSILDFKEAILRLVVGG